MCIRNKPCGRSSVVLRISALLLFIIAGMGNVRQARAQTENLFWLNTQTGDAVVWYLNGINFNGNYDYLGTGIPTQWQIVANGDFNGDTTTDLIWQNSQTGDVSYWLMNGPQRIASDYIARNIPLAWKVVGAADFNGDGSLDLVWQNIQTGDTLVWYMDGVTWTGSYNYLGRGIPTQWRIAGVADMNSDGMPDLIWTNIQTGDVSFWAMNGTSIASSGYVYRNVPLAWKIVGVGDFNSDGKPDIVWQNLQTGDVTLWYMNGILWTGSWDYLAHNVPLAWRIFGCLLNIGNGSGTIQ